MKGWNIGREYDGNLKNKSIKLKLTNNFCQEFNKF